MSLADGLSCCFKCFGYSHNPCEFCGNNKPMEDRMANKQSGLVPYKELTLGAEVGFQNPRTSFDPKIIRELADSIADRGLIYRLQVWKTKVDKKPVNVVVGGSRRYKAIGLLIKERRGNGIGKGVECRFIDALDIGEAREIAVIDNIQREQLTSFEIANEIVAMEARGFNKTQIAEKIRKSISWVSRLMTAHTNATPELRKAWADGKLPDDDIQSIAKLGTKGDGGKAQNARLTTVLELRKPDTKRKAKAGKTKKAAPKKRGAARAAAKGKAKPKRTQKPSKDGMLLTVKVLTKKMMKKDHYVRGVVHGIEAALGARGLGEFDPDWEKFMTKHGLGGSGTDKKKAKK